VSCVTEIIGFNHLPRVIVVDFTMQNPYMVTDILGDANYISYMVNIVKLFRAMLTL